MREDRRSEGWEKIRRFVEKADLMTVEEAVGALLELLDLDGPEDVEKPAQGPVEQLLRGLAFCLMLEVRYRYDSFAEIVEEP